MAKQPPGSIILIDRWCPTDAAFRRIVPFVEILQLNVDRNVRVPDPVIRSPFMRLGRALIWVR